MTTTDPRTTAGEPSGPGSTGDAGDASGLSVVALSQGQLVRRRFFRHRGALGGMAVLLFVVVLAFSSIGFAGIPGWWHYGFTQPTPIENGGRPTLDLIPWFDGDGLAWGDHPFGQDNIGIDYFALTMRGAQRSLIIAFMVGIVATVIGTLVGALAGYYRGWADSLLMRVTDVFITIPVIVIGAVLGRRYGALPIALFGAILGVLLWTSLARLVRGSFLSLREKEFVEAARAMGASSSRIIFKHILPNSLGVIIVSATLTIAVAILVESALSYLGLGVRPPETSLGLLISNYESAFTTRPWLFWWPGLFIVLIALSVNFIGDGLRDAFDPRQARVRS
ncbi:ABC transporter permease [Quadrisphaera setariae]|uniref:ABC transporter permease n=1 Tax=Quadrisphaera setariae TaxID=2593304 RepID=A0A5C8ZF75_9ACTN|nr:ABC transporter permease [Quadrisphaera setariae]TXR56497.1 ABC transporter permease [Quadrisphaera setariae]